MPILQVERLGGLANFGGPRARIRSRGQLDTSQLSPTELKVVDSLFKSPAASEPSADGFRFRITRTTDEGSETIVASESDVPATLASCVKDEFV